MDATREHVSVSAEWLTAAVFLVATVVVALLVVREMRVLPATAPPPATSDSVEVPVDAVSVPSLALRESEQIRVGDAVEPTVARLEHTASLERRGIGRGPFGAREVRAYTIAGTRFYIVFEPFELRGAPRVAAIYLQ